MAIFRVRFGDEVPPRRPVLEGLADAVRFLRDGSNHFATPAGIETCLGDLLIRLRDAATKIADGAVRGRELVEIVAAQLALGRVDDAVETYRSIGHRRVRYNGRVAMLLHAAGADEAALATLQDIRGYTSAAQCIEYLAELYPDHRTEIVQRLLGAANEVLVGRPSAP